MTNVPPLDRDIPDQGNNPLFAEIVEDDIVPDHLASKSAESKKDEREDKKPFGGNRTKTGAVAKLTAADQRKITNFYSYLALAVAPFNSKAAVALADNGEKCSEAWVELANQNIRVRKAILGMLEGGAWGMVIGAHVPIILASLPEHMREQIPFLSAMDDESE